MNMTSAMPEALKATMSGPSFHVSGSRKYSIIMTATTIMQASAAVPSLRFKVQGLKGPKKQAGYPRDSHKQRGDTASNPKNRRLVVDGPKIGADHTVLGRDSIKARNLGPFQGNEAIHSVKPPTVDQTACS